MKVTLVAETYYSGYDRGPLAIDTTEYTTSSSDINIDMADDLAEFAGRLCYKSWDRPNPATATNGGYLHNIIEQGHFSVLEHATATFYITGVSRSLTHELVRHRHLSFSQVSQRYVDESEAEMVVPPVLKPYLEEPFGLEEEIDGLVDPSIGEVIDYFMSDARSLYVSLVDLLVSKGIDRKAARGAARSVLPNATETALVVTGNLRTWREVLQKRLSPAADAEIRELAELLLEELVKVAPNSFQDFPNPTLLRASRRVVERHHSLFERLKPHDQRHHQGADA